MIVQFLVFLVSKLRMKYICVFVEGEVFTRRLWRREKIRLLFVVLFDCFRNRVQRDKCHRTLPENNRPCTFGIAWNM